MQLTSGTSSLRARLRSAACVLLAVGAPVVAHAEAPAAKWQFDATGLAYGEKGRTTIVEPVARLTRLFADGQSFSAQFTLDAMTGASPSGAQPSGKVVTTTSASGTVSTSRANELPTRPFRDMRGAVDLSWVRPIGGAFTLTTGGHVSRERDYSSVGGRAQASLDLDHHLFTISGGAGVNRDQVFPMGGIPVGLQDRSVLQADGTRGKDLTDMMVGVSRVLTRRCLVAVNATRTHESGYLTEPYKVVSVLDATGAPASELAERRPDTRDRTAVLGSTVYHLQRDVVYGSYRWYHDDWGVRSHTVDLKYRTDLPEHDWLQPHLRWYSQRAADFFVFGLHPGASLPRYATSDLRLGPLRSATLGLTYGCPVPSGPGELTLRGEYIRQWGNGHPVDAIGVQRSMDLFPGEDTFTLVAGWSVQF